MWTHPYGVVIIGKVGISVYSNSSRIVLIAIEEYIFGLLKDLNTRKPHRSMFRCAGTEIEEILNSSCFDRHGNQAITTYSWEYC